jgi:hypothetical protein
MDAMSFISAPGVPTSTEYFLNTIKTFRRTAWNAYPCRHYFGMITVEQIEDGWSVRIAPVGAGETVSTTYYGAEEEERLSLEVARKMHPTLICVCSRESACFSEQCHVRPV